MDDSLAGDDEVEGGGARKVGGKRLFLLLIPLVLLLIGGGVAWALGLFDAKKDAAEGHEGETAALPAYDGPPVFVPLEDMLVNLMVGPGQKQQYLKLQVQVELAHPDHTKAIETHAPRIREILVAYLGQLRPEEIGGSAGFSRLKQEIRQRLNLVLAGKGEVKDVLLTNLLVQ